MRDNPLHFTIRELQRVGGSPILWATLAGVALLLGLAGPFGTYDALPVPGRLAFWAAIVVSTYFTGFATVCLLEAIVFREQPGPLGYGLLGLASGLPVTLVVWTVNLAVFGSAVVSPGVLALYVVLIAGMVSGLVAFVSTRLAKLSQPAAMDGSRPASPPLLQRLPAHRRGRLLYMSMQDHYVEVSTDRGQHLVLMRLSDAIVETAGADGVRIHRSHWVAKDAVREAVRRNGRLYLRMSDGAELPVSRNHVEKVRDAGLV